MKIHQKNQGFTLIELLVYISTASIVVLIILSVIFLLMQSQAKREAISEVEQQGNFALDIITQYLRNADEIISPEIGMRGSELELININGSEVNVNFYLDNEVLYIKDGEDPAVNITSEKVKISDLFFENLGSEESLDLIKISFVATKEANRKGSYFYQNPFYTSVCLRK